MLFEFAISCLGDKLQPFWVDEDEYSLVVLWADTKMTVLGLHLEKNETMDVHVRLPWKKGERIKVETDRELLNVFRMFRERDIDRIQLDVDFLPKAWTMDGDEIPLSLSAPAIEQDSQPIANHEPATQTHSKSIPNFEPTTQSHSQPILNFEPATQTHSPTTQTHSQPIPNDHVDNDHGEFDPHEIFGWTDDDDDDDEVVGDTLVVKNTCDSSGSEVDLSDFESDGEGIPIGSDSEDETLLERLSRGMTGNVFKPLENGEISFRKGQVFDNVKQFRTLLNDYAVQEGFTLIKCKNEAMRVTACCGNSETCPWRIHASPMFDGVTFKIKTYHKEHTCLRVTENPLATGAWIANKLGDWFRENPDANLKKIREAVMKKIGIECHKQKLYRAKRFALADVGGDHANCYPKLHRYANVLRLVNPGTVALVKSIRPVVSENPEFQRFFLSFPAQKSGYLNGCRPFIGLDGCHLRGPFGGVLLTAVCLDANSSLFPLAVGICESENLSSWSWFLELLHEHIGVHETRTITFMTDRQKGVLNALALFFQRDKNRYCARHIFANFKVKFPGLLVKNLFWAACKATNRQEFTYKIEAIKSISVSAYDWLMTIPASHWSRHAFDVSVKNDHVTNNMTESFNSKLNLYRDKSVLSLLEYIRRVMMKRFHKRHNKALAWTNVVPPTVQDRINLCQREARDVRVIWAGNEEFEVIEETTVLIVNLDKFTCDCGAWQVSGIPCKHAMACITKKRANCIAYVDRSLTKAAYIATYNNIIHPVPDETKWPEVAVDELLPPSRRRLPGRPKVCRRRENDEPMKEKRSFTLRCGICKGLGHNKRSCTQGLAKKNARTSKDLDNQGLGNASVSKTTPLKEAATSTAASTSTSAGPSTFGRGGRKRKVL